MVLYDFNAGHLSYMKRITSPNNLKKWVFDYLDKLLWTSNYTLYLLKKGTNMSVFN